MIYVKPRNDYVLIEISDDGNDVLAVGPLVDDVRVGDRVLLPDVDLEAGEEAPWHAVGEDTILVREQLIMAFDLSPLPPDEVCRQMMEEAS